MQGELIRLAHGIAACAVWQILQDAGIDPAPRILGRLALVRVETRPARSINLANYQVRRRSILDGLTSEYQLAA